MHIKKEKKSLVTARLFWCFQDHTCIYLSNYMFIYPFICYQTRVWLLTAQKPIIERQMSMEGKGALIKSWQTGRGWTQVWDHLPRLCTAMTAIKGKGGEESQWIIEAGGWVLHSSPQSAGSLTLSSYVFLPMWTACSTAKGAVGNRELVIL